MVSEFSVVWISMSVIVLCWAVVKLNQKIDEMIRNYKYTSSLDGQTQPDEAPADRHRSRTSTQGSHSA